MDNVKIGTPQSMGLSPLRETVLGACDGYTYTQLLDNGYGLTPITPSNSAETALRTPIRTQVNILILIIIIVMRIFMKYVNYFSCLR